MCGRFTLQLPPEFLAEIFGLTEVPAYPARYNIAPTQKIPTIRTDADYRNRFDLLSWGLIPSWAKDKSQASHMINARSETIAEKPAFKQAFKHRRCLIPSSGFYEWFAVGKEKHPLFIHLKNDLPMVFAGIWEHWKSPEGENIETCSILTTASNKLIEPIHDRMPVILHPQEFDLWLDRDLTEHEKLKQLFQPYPADLMDMYQVSTMVNSPRNDSPELIKPLTE